MEVLPLRASDVRSLDNCINVVVVRVFKLSSNVNVQVVRSMLDLNDILSLVAKRRSRFLCNLDCVPFQQNYSVLHFSSCSFFFNFYISCDVVFLLHFVFVYLCISCAAIIFRIKLSIRTVGYVFRQVSVQPFKIRQTGFLLNYRTPCASSSR